MLSQLKKFNEEEDESQQQQQENNAAVEQLITRLSFVNRLNRLTFKSFYFSWNSKNHERRGQTSKGDCCFYHILGAAQKDGKDMPLLPYQQLLYQQLQQQKCIWIKKSRGLGVTTFFLYWLAYCCLTRYQPGDRVCVVVGPRIDLAQDLIDRFKKLFLRNFPDIYSELAKQGSTYSILNGVKVECFPSHHVDSLRGLDKVKMILSDESDYYPPFQQKELRAVMEGYLGKPNSGDIRLILCSTPNAPNGLMQQIELEQQSLYYKF